MGLVVGAVVQHRSGGLQIELLAVGCLLGLAGTVSALPSRWAATTPPAGGLLGLVALVAIDPQGVAEWGQCLAVWTCVAAIASLRAERPLPGAPWVAKLGALAGAAVCGAALLQGHVLAGLSLVVLGPFLWEAWAGWRAETPGARLRRAACGGVLVAAHLTELVRASSWEWRLPLTPGLLAAGGATWLALSRGLPEAPDPARRRAARRTVLRTLVPLVVFLLLYGLGELLFQVVPNRYQRLVVPERNRTAHLPNTESEYTGWPYQEPSFDEPVKIRWNRHGWWDADHELANTNGARRVLVVGDSFVEGVQVSLEDHYHVRLGKALAASSAQPVEAIAYGWSGWGQRQALEALTRGAEDDPQSGLSGYPPGLDYEPELVVLEVLPGNDVLNNLPELEQRANEASASVLRRHFGRSLERGLYFSAFLADRGDLLWRGVTGGRDPVDAGVYFEVAPRYPELWREAWQRTEALLERIKAAVEARGARLVVVLFTSFMELDELREGPVGDYRFRYPSERVLKLCGELEIPCLDLAPLLVEHEAEHELHLPHDGHWSAAGHRLAAEATARWLLETGLWTPESR